VPVHEMMTFIIPLLLFMFAGIALSIIFANIKNKKLNILIAILIILLILFTNFWAFNKKIEGDRWIKTGLDPLPTPLLKAADYIITNTGVNDVILTNHELGFAINAVTGRKLVSTPRGSHNTAIADLNTRDAELAVILYGTNDDERERLMKKYGVKYLFWSNEWLRLEFTFNQKGQIAGLFDPLEVLDKPKWREYLNENKVQYTPMHTELNPNKRGKAKKFDVLVISPRANITHPWNPALNKYLKLELKYPEKNPTVKVYKVEID
jgi:hypothetical protein